MQISVKSIKATAMLGVCWVMLAPTVHADSHGNAHVHSREFKGQVYVMYHDHMSLYTYDNDALGVSTCVADCAQTWMPALLPAGTELGENYSLIVRDDGSMQAAFRGMPLYLYSGDARPGDINGDGVDGLWRLARP